MLGIGSGVETDRDGGETIAVLVVGHVFDLDIREAGGEQLCGSVAGLRAGYTGDGMPAAHAGRGRNCVTPVKAHVQSCLRRLADSRRSLARR